MEEQRRYVAPPPPLPPVLLLLLFAATPLADLVTPRRSQDSRVLRMNLLVAGDSSLQSTSKIRPGAIPTLRQLLEWRSEDEDEDDPEEGSGMTSPPSLIPLHPPSPTHRLRHDKGRAGMHSDRSSLDEAATSSTTAPADPAPSPPPRRRMRVHDACYSSNEVLLVVGVTCAVNFAFILLVVALVHLCNRGAGKVVPNALDYETPADCDPRGRRRGVVPCSGLAAGEVDVTGGSGPAGAYVRVQEYVDSLPDALTPFHDEDDGGDDGIEGGETRRAEADARRDGNRAQRRRSSHGLQTAFSMEQLLFVD